MVAIRRGSAMVGLVFMALIGWGLATGSMSLFDGGIRAAGVLVGVLVVSSLLRFGVRQFADTLDGTWIGEPRVIESTESQ